MEVTASPQTSAGPSPTSGLVITPGTIPGSGVFDVGRDIQPGTYVSETPPDVTCYAARLGAKNSPDPLIANYVVKGRSTVTIEASDAYFETRDCAIWRKR